MADCMQFLSENRLNGCQIFGQFGFLKTESEPKFGFPHIPSIYLYKLFVIKAADARCC